MRKPQEHRVLAAAALAIAACGRPAPTPSPPAPPGWVRLGPDRDEIAYEERSPAAKKKLLRKINADREAHGAPPLAYDLLAAKVGDAFCRDAAAGGFLGHWDLAGRPPYLRWALAGGVDLHAQNAGAVSRGGWEVAEAEIGALLLDSHARMMAERPPDDGHRRAILDPKWTHVGIGVAWQGGEFRMTEEFVRRVAEWVELPAGPVPAGGSATIRVRLPDGWAAGLIEVAHDPPPVPMTAAEIGRRTSYALPRGFVSLRPVLAPPMRYRDGIPGEFTEERGRLEARIPLTVGPGSYYAVLFAEKGPVAAGATLWPVAVVRIEAR
jgi:uncharacterized protein YkwD